MSNARPGDGSSRSADDALMAEVESLLASEETERSGGSRWSERQGWREWIKTTTNGQITYVGLLGTLLPGALGALDEMGGGGNVDPATLSKGTTVSLATSIASYFVLSIPLFELAGLKIIGIGGWAYVLHPAAVLYYSFYRGGDLVTAASALLGMGSALFWVGQGALLLSYPPPQQRARSIATFWVIYNLGSILAGVLTLVSNHRHPDHGTVSNRTYVVFIWVALFGAGMACYITNPWEVKRPDGTVPWSRPSGRSRSSFLDIVKREMLSILDLRQDKRIMMLLPFFLSSSWFLAYRQTMMGRGSSGEVSRIVSLILVHGPECVGALIVFILLEHTRFQPHLRRLLLWIALSILTNLAMLITLYEGANPESQWVAISSLGSVASAGELGLLVLYGLLDGLWQTTCYYLLGCLSSSPSSAAKLVAVFKLCQTINQAVIHHLATCGMSTQVQVLLNWVLITIGLVCALPTIRRLDEATSQDSSPRIQPESVIEDHDGTMEMSRA